MLSDEPRRRRFIEALAGHGAAGTWKRMIAGYLEATPGGGVHTMAHVPGHVAGNVVLARAVTDGGPRPLIETRGEGGFVVVAPSNGPTHPSGRPWALQAGGFGSIATVTVDEWDALVAAAAECNEVGSPEATVLAPRRLTVPQPWAGGPVGESWMDVSAAHLEATDGVLGILLRHGWSYWRDTPEMIYVTRPGDDKQGGVSAQIKRANGRLLNYSSSVPEFECWPTFRGDPPRQAPTRSYDAADVLAVYEFEGDRAAALRSIAEQAGIYAAWQAEQKGERKALDGIFGSRPVAGAAAWRGLIVDGRAWLSSGSPVIETVWGDKVDVLVPRLQPTLIVGETGAGKTTLVHHLILGAMGLPNYADLLSWPVQALPEGERVLYLAADRPDQARLAMLRHFGPMDPEAWRLAEERLRVWQGPPPQSLARATGLLVEMAEWCNAGMVVVDSEKDMATQLTDDHVGAAVNQAHQLVVASGRSMIGLHHPRKRGREHASERPTIDDVYGSAWLVAGAGRPVPD